MKKKYNYKPELVNEAPIDVSVVSLPRVKEMVKVGFIEDARMMNIGARPSNVLT